MLHQLYTSTFIAACLLGGVAQANPNAVAANLADSQIQTHLAIKSYDLAERYLSNNDIGNAQVAYEKALEAAQNAVVSVERGLADIMATRNMDSLIPTDDLDTAIARITVANSGLLRTISMLKAKSKSPESRQSALANTLSNVTTELINGTMYASMAANPNAE